MRTSSLYGRIVTFCRGTFMVVAPKDWPLDMLHSGARVLTADGKLRSLREIGKSVSGLYFPAAVTVKGKQVSGRCVFRRLENDNGNTLIFVATGKNKNLIRDYYYNVAVPFVIRDTVNAILGM